MRSFVFRSVVIILFISVPVFAQQISLDEVVQKHAASSGPSDSVSKQKNRFLMGDAGFSIQGSAAQINGKVGILSDKTRVIWALQFHSNDYPQDKFGFDGKKAVINRSSPQGRSFLTQFLNENKKLIEDGIFGGVLSGAWGLTLPAVKERLKVSGTKNVGGRETVVVDYIPKGGDFSSKLYFDKETLQHLRSEHTSLRAAVQGSGIDSSAGQSGTVIKLTEEFADFKKMGDLILPTTYKVVYSRTAGGTISTKGETARENIWQFKITDYSANQDLGDDAFSLSN
jgi:hypothetical protein